MSEPDFEAMARKHWDQSVPGETKIREFLSGAMRDAYLAGLRRAAEIIGNAQVDNCTCGSCERVRNMRDVISFAISGERP